MFPWCALCPVSYEATACARQTDCHVRHCTLSAHSPWTVCGLARLRNRFRLNKVEHSAIHFLNQYCSLVYAGRMESLPHLRIPSCKSHGPHTEAAQTVKIKPFSGLPVGEEVPHIPQLHLWRVKPFSPFAVWKWLISFFCFTTKRERQL